MCSSRQVGWLALRIGRLVAVVRRLVRERSRRNMAAQLDIAFPDFEEDTEEEMSDEDDSPGRGATSPRLGRGGFGGAEAARLVAVATAS